MMVWNRSAPLFTLTLLVAACGTNTKQSAQLLTETDSGYIASPYPNDGSTSETGTIPSGGSTGGTTSPTDSGGTVPDGTTGGDGTLAGGGTDASTATPDGSTTTSDGSTPPSSGDTAAGDGGSISNPPADGSGSDGGTVTSPGGDSSGEGGSVSNPPSDGSSGGGTGDGTVGDINGGSLPPSDTGGGSTDGGSVSNPPSDASGSDGGSVSNPPGDSSGGDGGSVPVCSETASQRLLAGQHYDVGTVSVTQSGDILTVQIVLKDSVGLYEMHTNIGSDKSQILGPPGSFPYKDDRIPGASSYQFTISLSAHGLTPQTPIYLAVHAVVAPTGSNSVLDGRETAWAEGEKLGRNWSMLFQFLPAQCE